MELSFSKTSHFSLLTALTATGIPHKPAANNVTSLKLADGTVLTGEVAVARAISRASNLAGSDASSQAEVDEWLEALAAFGPAVLSLLDKALASRTYAAGYSLSIADIALFLVAHAHGASAGANVTRWVSMCNGVLPVAQLETALGLPAAGHLPWGGVALATPPAPAAAPIERSVSAASSATAKSAGSKATVVSTGADSLKGQGKAVVAKDGAKQDKAAAPDAKAGDKAGAKVDGKGKPAGAKPAAGAGTSKNIGGGGSMGAMPKLEGGEMGKVVTRFPPEPSGYLHIGHVKALLLNDYYAKVYGGKMVVRFDDTNPSKEKEEYEENILKDLKALGVSFVSITHTSDYFDVIEGHARRLIKEGKAYMDDTPREEMQRERTAMINSKHRDTSPEENMKRFDVMLKGGEEGSKWCLRAKMNMQDVNGTCRDPVLYRCNDTPHHRTGTKYKAYPTYDLACPIVDSLEGVTHALRSSEYHDRDEQYYRLIDLLGIRKVLIQDFARLNFVYTLLSKRKLTWFVDNKIVDGWYDPRFPTVQGVLRRGATVPAIREFILSQGASKRQIEMEWDKFWAINKKHIDPVAPRYTALPKDGLVKVQLTNGPATPEYKTHPMHPKNPEVGLKAVLYTSNVFLDIADVSEMKEGEEITLMKWGNAFIRKINKDATGKITSAVGELNPGGDVKKTEKKVTWLPDSTENVPITMCEFDYLITKENLLEGEDFRAAMNPVTKLETTLIGEPAMRLLQTNSTIQIERKGFFRCDRAFLSEDRPAILFFIPDGKVKGLFGLADRVKGATAAK